MTSLILFGSMDIGIHARLFCRLQKNVSPVIMVFVIVAEVGHNISTAFKKVVV